MTPFTHPRLVGIAGYLDGVRAELTALAEAAPAEALVRAPEGGWSAAQIVQHLGKVEGSTAKLLERLFAAAIESGLADETSTESVLGALNRFNIVDPKFRPLVAPERVAPEPNPDFDTCWASLAAARERTYRAFATVDGKALGTIVAPHPFLGPFTAYEWLLFLGKHEERHIDQWRRTVHAG